MENAKKYDLMYKVGTVFLFIGVIAWFPYMYFKYVLGIETNVTPYLLMHLSGVIPGAILRRYSRVKQKNLS